MLWTDYLLALVGVYAAFLLTTVLFRNTKLGVAVVKWRPKVYTEEEFIAMCYRQTGRTDPQASGRTRGAHLRIHRTEPEAHI
jgi:hypothetical protein